MNFQRPSHLVLVREPVVLLQLSLARAKAIGVCLDAANDNRRRWPPFADERRPFGHR